MSNKRKYLTRLGFKSMKTAYATIKGFEIMRSLKKGQARFFQLQKGIIGEVRLIERCFKLGDSVKFFATGPSPLKEQL